MSDTWGQDHWDNIDGDLRHMDWMEPGFIGETSSGEIIRRCPHCNKRSMSENKRQAKHPGTRCGYCLGLINIPNER